MKSLFSCLILSIFLVAGCAGDSSAPAGAVSGKTPGKTAERIVSLIPCATSIVYAIGAGDRLVGITRYCRTPEGASKPAVVGGILDVSLEAVAAARPDLVIGSPGVLKGRLTDILGNAGVRFLPLDFEDIEDVRTGITKIGKVTGLEDQAWKELAFFDSRLAALSGKSSGARVIFVVGTKPLVVAGDLSFQGQLLAAMGLENVVHSDRLTFPTWSLEQVMQAEPDVIIDGIVGNEPSAALLSEAGLKAHVVRMPDDGFLLPASDAITAAEKLRDAVADAVGAAAVEPDSINAGKGGMVN